MIFQATMRLCLKEKWSLDSVPGDHFGVKKGTAKLAIPYILSYMLYFVHPKLPEDMSSDDDSFPSVYTSEVKCRSNGCLSVDGRLSCLIIGITDLA